MPLVIKVQTVSMSAGKELCFVCTGTQKKPGVIFPGKRGIDPGGVGEGECGNVPEADNSYFMESCCNSCSCQVVWGPSKAVEKTTLLAAVHFEMGNTFQYLTASFSLLQFPCIVWQPLNISDSVSFLSRSMGVLISSLPD